MEIAKEKRRTLRSQTTKLISKVEQALENETDEGELQKFLEKLQLKVDQLKEIDSEIQGKITEVKDIEDEILKSDEYQESLVEWKCEVKRAIDKQNTALKLTASQGNESQANTSKRETNKVRSSEAPYIKLPCLTIEKFNGNPSDWQRFWDQYESAIHNNNDISNVDKFNYLKSYVVSSASDSIKGFSLTNDNYLSAIDALKERFGKKTLVVNSHLNKLLNLTPVKKSSDIYLLRKLYDTCQTEIRNLEALGLKTEMFGCLLSPILIKLLPADIVLEITRKCGSSEDWEVSQILSILQAEIESREKMLFLIQGNDKSSNPQFPAANMSAGMSQFDAASKHVGMTHQNKSHDFAFGSRMKRNISSAADLLNTNRRDSQSKMKNYQCIFCANDCHVIQDCNVFSNKSLKEKKDFLLKRGACFVCLRLYHTAGRCRSYVKCTGCLMRHYAVMCPQLEADNKTADVETVKKKELINRDEALANKTCKQDVLMQTLTVRLRNKDKNNEIIFRALIDSGSQHSYISKEMVNKMGYFSEGQEKMKHGLFGGLEETRMHNRYRIFLSSLDRDYSCNFEAYDQDKICAEIPKIKNGPWIKEAKKYGINFPDLENPRNNNEIHLLIGADICGKLFTGQYKLLSSGLAAIETKLGWTLMGKIPQINKRGNDTSLLVLSLHVRSDKIKDLWELDVLGIKDPAETQTRRDQEAAAKEYFLKTLNRHTDGRYEVSLPWLEGHRPLTNNRYLAIRRLQYTMKTLQSKNLVKDYEAVFADWMTEGIIEPVDLSKLEDATCFYLPHRAVVKEASTTKIRPVFDASARQVNTPSLNDCLERGPNLIELIPSILNRFRLRKFGVIADIKKAFLQISVNEEERDYLRFLWFEGGDPGRMKIYRHNRVVFGINASPFLLAATIAYHLDEVPSHQQVVAQKLKNSMYVDNCVTSLETEAEMKHFIEQSKKIMSTAQFDLRGWESNATEENGDNFADHGSVNDVTPILGLQWNKRTDTLSLMRLDEKEDAIQVSKRTILSTVSKIFDPIGFTIPVTIIPKMILQECWKTKLKWDEELPVETKKKFEKWKQQLHMLREIEIPRKLSENRITEGEKSLHVFCDASKIAYATCIFFRLDFNGKVSCRLIQSKARIAPLKQISIPRLELLSCVIGARLARGIIDELQIENLQVFYWSDSTNALHWIRNDGNWATFVQNRVAEIRKLSHSVDWNHVPGVHNPADLPSRGCSPEVLTGSRWWEGPQWLKNPPELWPKVATSPDPEIIDSERRKSVVSAVNSENEETEIFDRFSSYTKMIKLVAWIYRFFNNCKVDRQNRKLGSLIVSELKEAEVKLIKIVQRESFNEATDKRLRVLQPIRDSNGLIRVKTRILRRQDSENFRFPILLPSDHSFVRKLILERHLTMGHAGVQFLMSNLREDFWILKCRKTVRKIIRGCIRCRRFDSRPVEIPTAPLPEDRVREATVFEIIGVDLAGPLYLRGNEKSWIVIFTCAVFRAVHLELVSALSTENFLQAFRRFIARRGRPSIVYSDNGRNFTGADNLFKKIDWNVVMEQTTVRRIRWKFIPPAAPWWGGWWERLIGTLKRILRKVLGKTSLNFEELNTVLCDCESFMNNRPLTYISEDIQDLEPLTPSMFIQEIREVGVPELDYLDASSMNKRYAYRQRIRTDLRKRFRAEYLGQLRQTSKCATNKTPVKVGDIVIISHDNLKRLDWPLGKVIEIYPGKDDIARVVKLKTNSGMQLRPVQRLYPLELSAEKGSDLRQKVSPISSRLEAVSEIEEGHDSALHSEKLSPDSTGQHPTITRSGRVVRPPDRLML